MNEFLLLGDGLCRLFVQAGLLLGIHFLKEQAAREFLRLFRKTDTLGLLAEEHLRIFGESLLGAEETLIEPGVFFSELSVLGLQGLHLFLFFGSHFNPFFLYVKLRKNGHICKSMTVFFNFIMLIFRMFFHPSPRPPSGHPGVLSNAATGASDRQ